MKRSMPFALDISSDDDDEPSPSNGTKTIASVKRSKSDSASSCPAKQIISEEALMKCAKMYQEYMQEIPIPTQRGSVIPFTSWTGLAKSMKQLYQQPLHYLTNVRVKEWDQMRIGSSLEDTPLDTIIHPSKAETNIWLMEEVHRLTSSDHFLTKQWLADPMYYASIDSIFPQLSTT